MATVGDAVDAFHDITYATILPYFELMLPQHMDLLHIVSNYTYNMHIRRVFRLTEQNITDAGFDKHKTIGYMYRTHEIATVCQQVHGSISSLIQGNGTEFYKLYDDRDPCTTFGAAQRIRILVFAVALKQELIDADRMLALSELSAKTNVISITSIANKLRRLVVTNWYKCVTGKYLYEFTLVDIKKYIADVALYYMITKFALSDEDLKTLCDTRLYAHVSMLKETSPVCAVETSITDLTQELAKRTALVTKLSTKVAALVTYHARQPHVTIKDAKIALGHAVFELRHTLQLLCIKEVNDHFGL